MIHPTSRNCRRSIPAGGEERGGGGRRGEEEWGDGVRSKEQGFKTQKGDLQQCYDDHVIFPLLRRQIALTSSSLSYLSIVLRRVVVEEDVIRDVIRGFVTY